MAVDQWSKTGLTPCPSRNATSAAPAPLLPAPQLGTSTEETEPDIVLRCLQIPWRAGGLKSVNQVAARLAYEQVFLIHLCDDATKSFDRGAPNESIGGANA